MHGGEADGGGLVSQLADGFGEAPLRLLRTLLRQPPFFNDPAPGRGRPADRRPLRLALRRLG
jgi:hypothetical protein